MIPTRRLLAAAITLAACFGIAGCASPVALEPAPEANSPECAEVTVRLPGDLGGQARRWTDAQATGAWGDPATILLTCGVTPPGPTTLPCETRNGVDWIIDDAEAPQYRFTTFGRVPAVEVYLDSEKVASADVIETLSAIADLLPTDGSACTERPADEG